MKYFIVSNFPETLKVINYLKIKKRSISFMMKVLNYLVKVNYWLQAKDLNTKLFSIKIVMHFNFILKLIYIYTCDGYFLYYFINRENSLFQALKIYYINYIYVLSITRAFLIGSTIF